MAASTYIRDMRKKIGHDLLLIPCVAAVITDHEGRILLQEKSDGEAWSLPAGGIEPGESPEIAVIREVLEETGLHVTVQGILGVFGGADFRYEYPNMDKVEYTVILYRCKAIGESAYPKDAETVSLAYFTEQDMPPLALPYPKKILFGHLDENRKGY
jgi:8-oxo-dGTP pyrophosphatase MutT (NUDIX family)